MPALGGQTFIELSSDVTLWYADLPARHRELVDVHWRRLARTPELSILEHVDGEPVRISFVKIDDGRVWGYRFTFIVDEETQARARDPGHQDRLGEDAQAEALGLIALILVARLVRDWPREAVQSN